MKYMIFINSNDSYMYFVKNYFVSNLFSMHYRHINKFVLPWGKTRKRQANIDHLAGNGICLNLILSKYIIIIIDSYHLHIYIVTTKILNN